ncbi:hypothetical protein BKA65DRAFT_554973 [Rhexocercosporidium sp. MPI-PUGE-AT-0058]|nr:hypothetical protein BKA65DRAFT_554973 [Rhexocercosporidium sp. MPI-PUGE-AT-0058]
MADIQPHSDESDTRPPSLSETSSEAASDQSSISSTSTSPPPTPHDIDRWNRHITLQEFGASLNGAARALFPNERTSRYTCVTVLMISWQDEDPRLPVSLEIAELIRVFTDIYHYDVEEFKIPALNPHYALNRKIMGFVEPAPNDKEHLKIVYYAGHGRLTKTRLLEWTSGRDKPRSHPQSRIPSVQWSGIQVLLEQAESDALILLDCCAAGTSNAGGGSGVTELIAACPYNGTANGVGPYSFTNALVVELKELSLKRSFSVGELYSNIFLRAQCQLSEHGRDRPAPIHLPLTRQSKFPRSIQLSIRSELEHCPTPAIEAPGTCQTSFPHIAADSPGQESSGTTSKSPTSLPTMLPKTLSKCFVPRLLFAVRLKESFQSNELSTEMLTEWLRTIPLTSVEEIKVEAGFQSFSSLVIVSVPIAMSAYFPAHPAVSCLGPVTSRNVFSQTKEAAYMSDYPSKKKTKLSDDFSPVILQRKQSLNVANGRKKRSQSSSSSWAEIRPGRSPSEPWKSSPLAIPDPVLESQVRETMSETAVDDVAREPSAQSEKSLLKHNFGIASRPHPKEAPVAHSRPINDHNDMRIMQKILEIPSRAPKDSEKSTCVAEQHQSSTPGLNSEPPHDSSSTPGSVQEQNERLDEDKAIDLDDLDASSLATRNTTVGVAGSKWSPLSGSKVTWSSSMTSLQTQLSKRFSSILGHRGAMSILSAITKPSFLVTVTLEQKVSRSPSARQLSAAREALRFAMTNDGTQSDVTNTAWRWYISYLEHRIRAAWVPLFRPILRDIDSTMDSPTEEDLAVVLRLFTTVGMTLRRCDDIALTDIVYAMDNEYGFEHRDENRSHVTQIAFAAIGWITLLYTPSIESRYGELELFNPEAMSCHDMVISSQSHQVPRRIKRQWNQSRTIMRYKQDFQLVDQPLPSLLQTFGAILPERCHGLTGDISPLAVWDSNYHDPWIEVHSISFQAVSKIAKIQIEWVDCLSFHLEFDSRTGTLKLFRFPSICLIMVTKQGKSGLLSQLLQDAQYARSGWSSGKDTASDYYREVILSYRLIFAERRSYSGFNNLEAAGLRSQPHPDPLLAILCGQSWTSDRATAIWNECGIYGDQMRYRRSDWQYFGDRLLRLQEYTLHSQSKGIAAVWYDKRDAVRWWTFWCVCVIGVSALLLGVLQTILLGLQLYFTMWPPEH